MMGSNKISTVAAVVKQHTAIRRFAMVFISYEQFADMFSIYK